MTFSNCKAQSCQKKAIFFTDYCLDHVRDKAGIIADIHKFISENESIKGYNFSEVPLDNFDFGGKDISFSIFSKCSMKNANLSKAVVLSTFLDFADLENADFSSSFIRFSIFGGANLKNANFLEAVCYSSNFLGANIENTIFRNADLTYTRFIGSNISKTSFINCNLKKTIFQGRILDEISMKSSNFQDALMIKENRNEYYLEDYKS